MSSCLDPRGAFAAATAILLSVLTPALVHAQPEGGGGPPATAVRVAEVREELLQQQRRVTGELRAIARSRVATIEAGIVLSMPVDIGSVVRRGDTLATLDDRRLRLDEGRLEAEWEVGWAILAARTATLRRARSDLEILSSLDTQRASFPKELADAEAAAAVAGARVDEAHADLFVLEQRMGLIRTRLDDLRITAPFDGVVVESLTEQGEWRAEGEPIVELLALGAYRGWLDVPEQLAGELRRPDATVQIDIEAVGRRLTDLRPTVVPLVDVVARRIGAFVRVDDAEGVLAPGMSIVGWLPTGERTNYLTLPRDALLRNAAGSFVYMVTPGPGGGTVASPASVDVLFDVGSRVAVRSSQLRGGSRVVVEGNERLFPMMPIAPTPEDPAEGPR